MYSVKEVFYSLQGEGHHRGRPAVFCRFSGCNLWSGREVDRGTAVCRFCDTDFVGTDGQGGGRFGSASELAQHISSFWTSPVAARYVVFTGGEPLLQLDSALALEVKRHGFEVAVETNGTLEPPAGIDWICVSPKAGAALKLTKGNELKVVFPQAGLDLTALEHLAFQHFFLQPMDGDKESRHLVDTVTYCLAHPQWHLSLQTHKWLHIR